MLLPTETTFVRPPSVELAPIATEFEPAVTVGLSVPEPFMSAAMPVVLFERIVLLLIVDDREVSWLLMLVTPVDSEATLLLVVLRPVDSELMPVDVEVESEATLLLVVLRLVDSELTAVDVEVDSDETVLLVVLRPVDSELTAVEVEVESEATLLLVAFRPVDSEATLLLVANSWLPLTASVLVWLIWPAATLVTWRSAPGAPTLNTPTGLLPAKLPKVRPPTLADETGTAAAVVAPLPIATELSTLATAFGPIATLFWPVAWLSASVELAWKYLMPFALMLSIAEPTLLLVVVVPSVL